MSDKKLKANFSLNDPVLNALLDAAQITISTAPIERALTECQKILGQMDTVNSSQISSDVKEIDASFSNGDFPEKVISFVDKKDLRAKKFGDNNPDKWDISACTKEDCPHRQQCNLNFTSYEICIWSIVHCRLNKPQELLDIIKEIAIYMKKVDKELGDKLENKGF